MAANVVAFGITIAALSLKAVTGLSRRQGNDAARERPRLVGQMLYVPVGLPVHRHHRGAA